MGLLSLSVGGAYWWFYNATYQYCDEPYIDSTPVTECDRLASGPYETNRVALPVWHQFVDQPVVQKACKEALLQYPQSPRLKILFLKFVKSEQEINREIEVLASACYADALFIKGRDAYLRPEKLSRVQLLLKKTIHAKAEQLGAGQAYLIRGLTEKNDKEQQMALLRSAELNNPIAEYAVALDLLETNVAQAALYMKRSANTGFPVAIAHLLLLSKDKKEFTVTPDEQKKWEVYLNEINELTKNTKNKRKP